jgi:hypothetical protein
MPAITLNYGKMVFSLGKYKRTTIIIVVSSPLTKTTAIWPFPISKYILYRVLEQQILEQNTIIAGFVYFLWNNIGNLT